MPRHPATCYINIYLTLLTAATILIAAVAQSLSSCPNACGSGASPPRGLCNSSTGLCSCLDAFAGRAWDCSERPCPSGAAWFDASSTAHSSRLPCSGKGTCSAGVCTCSSGYEGAACQRTSCPSSCSGRGRCSSLSDAASTQQVSYSAWDAGMSRGCVCDEGFGGVDCSQRLCPTGSDPLVQGGTAVQWIRTNVSVVSEVQELEFAAQGAGVIDVNDTQVIVLAGAAAVPTGSFTLTFDSTGADGTCALCTSRAVAATAAISMSASPATLASDVQAALDALPNIGVGGTRVTVAGSSATSVNISVAFVGCGVGGIVSLLQLSASSIVGATSALVVRTIAASQLSGNVTLSFNDSRSYPTQSTLRAGADYDDDAAMMPYNGLTVSVAITALEASIATALTQLTLGTRETPSRALAVSRICTGGPGIRWRVTFDAAAAVRWRGDLAPVDVASAAGLAITGAVATAMATSRTIVNGTFLSGSFTASVAYNNAAGQVQYTPASTAIAWNAPAATLSVTLTALDTGAGFGVITASRSRLLDAISGAWGGAYSWTLTFASLAESVPLMQVFGVMNGPSTATVSAGTQRAGDASAEINEVQIIDCVCPAGACTSTSAGVQLSFNGASTPLIPFNASAATVRAALITLAGIPDVVVNMYGNTAASLCDANGVSTAITFIASPGPQSRLYIATAAAVTLPATASLSLLQGPAYGRYGGRAKRGTRRVLSCSGRGSCDTSSGACTCFRVSNTAGAAVYVSSDNAGGERASGPASLMSGRRNCGYAPEVVTDCPSTVTGVTCSGRGTCSGAPSFVCTCNAGFKGFACEAVACPTGNAWFDIPIASGAAHAAGTECSARGTCVAGVCVCSAGYTGTACELSACPASQCGPSGSCVSMHVAHKWMRTDAQGMSTPGVLYTDWDAHQMRGCVCSRSASFSGPRGYDFTPTTGWDCSERMCAGGDDPYPVPASPPVPEVQQLTCNASSGWLVLTLRNVTSPPVAFNAYVRDLDADIVTASRTPTLEGALLRMNITGMLVISPAVATFPFLCDSNRTAVTSITFVSTAADVPQLVVAYANTTYGTNASVAAADRLASVSTLVNGTGSWYECNRRGVCDRSTGACACARPFAASDGRVPSSVSLDTTASRRNMLQAQVSTSSDCARMDDFAGLPDVEAANARASVAKQPQPWQGSVVGL